MRQIKDEFNMQSIDSKILTIVSKRGRGSIFFSSDFSSLGESKTILKSLERLTNNNKIIRLARGMYYYPKIDKVLGLGVLYPSLEEIAQAIAKRDKARIVPTGLYALNKLGISTQVPMNVVYLTDGSPRNIKIGNGKGIKFKHVVPKKLAFQNELAMLVTLALSEIKEENVTSEHLSQIKKVLRNEKKENIMKDASLMPAWIKSIITKAYE